VLPVSDTVPPAGFSTPPEGSFGVAEAAALRTTELSASPDTAAAMTFRLNRDALFNLDTGFSPCEVVGLVLL
jgi:hypothetical protein